MGCVAAAEVKVAEQACFQKAQHKENDSPKQDT
jgi:hypothetical protein